MRRRVAVVTAVIVAGAVIQARPWTWAWGSMWTDLRGNAGWLIACFGAGLAVSLLLARRGSPPAERTWPWVLSYPGVATVVGAVLAVGIVALIVMLRVAGDAAVAERPPLRIDAIKYSLGIFAGAGAVAALLIGVRRQRHLEQAQQHAEFDATQRRITDLYTKAVEQLGHTDAAVRLGGLYALERVAQNNPGQRATVVDVLCAYLRMPFHPSSEIETDTRSPHQERQVRMAAQSILAAHLTMSTETFWPDTDLNLAGAYLIDLSLAHCHIRFANFRDAYFEGWTDFTETTFTVGADFDGSAQSPV